MTDLKSRVHMAYTYVLLSENEANEEYCRCGWEPERCCCVASWPCEKYHIFERT